MNEERSPIQEGLDRRLEELSAAYHALARLARINTIVGYMLKGAVIGLGAFIAAGNTTTVLLGPADPTVHLCASMLISVLAGIDTLFHFERKAERQIILATQCRNKKREADLSLLKIRETASPTAIVAKEIEVLDNLHEYFREFHQQAATLKVNTVLALPSPYSTPRGTHS